MSSLGTETAFEMLAKARALEAQGREIIHLEIGEPDFDTPTHIVEGGVEALRQGYTHYAPTGGLPELREAIGRDIYKTREIEVSPDRVVVTPGAKPVISFTILALAQRGVEVIFPDPGFPIFESMIRFCGARAVPMPLLEENGFHPDLEDLASKINPRTRLIILNSPQNPTGSVLSKGEIEAVAGPAQVHSNSETSPRVKSGNWTGTRITGTRPSLTWTRSGFRYSALGQPRDRPSWQNNWTGLLALRRWPGGK